MKKQQLHKTQISILHSLRYAKSERFSDLMRPTEHTSDTFKFHLQKLIKLGYVAKTSQNTYELTPSGKEFANSLNEPERVIQKQPKISIMIVAARINANGETEYLLQQRTRNPHFGFMTEIHGRAKWGEPFEVTAAYQLKRQTNLEASFAVHSFRRIRDYDTQTDDMLEDKLFVIMKATNMTGELINSYAGGTNIWMTLDQLRRYDKYFQSTIAIIASLNSRAVYATDDLHYPREIY